MTGKLKIVYRYIMEKRLRIKMIEKGITLPEIAKKFGVTRQYVYQVILKGYPANGKAKKILNRFYKMIS